MMFATLDQARDQLQMDHNADDGDITLKIKAASKAVKNYLKFASPYEVERDEFQNPVLDSSGDQIPVEDSSGDYIVRDEVVQATLILVAEMYKNREGLIEDPVGGASQITYGYGYLPRSVVTLLYPLRDPALA